jgi:hypothetical protein
MRCHLHQRLLRMSHGAVFADRQLTPGGADPLAVLAGAANSDAYRLQSLSFACPSLDTQIASRRSEDLEQHVDQWVKGKFNESP